MGETFIKRLSNVRMFFTDEFGNLIEFDPVDKPLMTVSRRDIGYFDISVCTNSREIEFIKVDEKSEDLADSDELDAFLKQFEIKQRD